MNLTDVLTKKQKRTIQRDIDLIYSIKGITFPKNMEELKEIGPLSPRIKINDREIYLSKPGLESLRRITNFIYESLIFKDLLSHDDIFRGTIDEIGFWASRNLIPEGDEFIIPLNTRLAGMIDEYRYVCRVDGIRFDDIESISIGSRYIRKYDEEIISDVSGLNESIKKSITDEYKNSLVIIGTEKGSSSVSKEKFYQSAELSLSVLRLYSCSHYTHAMKKTNIRLINNCSNAYGPASSFGWNCSDKMIRFTRYFISEQELKIDKLSLSHWSEDCFFETITGLIDKCSRNELEESIVRALYWLGEAQKDKSNASAWVKLWSCIECFFTLNENKITEKNARGISSIILFGGYHHEKYRDYNTLKTTIKKFYKLRSKVVHHASYQHIDDMMLIEFSFLVSWTVITMASLLKKGYTDLSQVGDKVDMLDRSL